MSMYTIVFILVTILILIALSLFGLMISKLDKWIDKNERLGAQSIYKDKTPAEDKEINNSTDL